MTDDFDYNRELREALKVLKLQCRVGLIQVKLAAKKDALCNPGEAHGQKRHNFDDKTKRREETKVLKQQRRGDALWAELNTIMDYRLKILAAKGFQPRPGEPPHKDGYYYRSTKTGKPYRIKKGEPVERAVKRMLRQHEGPSAEKPRISDEHNAILSCTIYKDAERELFQKWNGKNTIESPPDKLAREDPVKFYMEITDSFVDKLDRIDEDFSTAIEKLYFDGEISDDIYLRLSTREMTDEDLEKYPELKKLSEKMYGYMNSFIEYFAKILDASPMMYRGISIDELNDMTQNSKIGGTRDGAAYFSIHKKIGEYYSQINEGVLLKFNPKGIDLKEHLGIHHKANAAYTLRFIALSIGIPLQRKKIEVSPDNLTIYITKEMAESNKARLSEYKKIAKVEVVDYIGQI